MARALLRWSVKDLANAAGVSVSTVKRMEDGAIGPGRSSLASVEQVKAAFEAGGAAFIPENGGGAGVRVAKPSKDP